MLTRKEWFNTIADKTIRDWLFRNGEELDKENGSLDKAIDQSFTWDESPEWDDYWSDIYDLALRWKLKLRKPLSYDL